MAKQIGDKSCQSNFDKWLYLRFYTSGKAMYKMAEVIQLLRIFVAGKVKRGKKSMERRSFVEV